jgi:hypothetical protein
MFAAESVVTGPHEAAPPLIVAELVLTCLFALVEASSHRAEALVPSGDRAILSSRDSFPAVDRSTGAPIVGWAIATDAKQQARRDARSAATRNISDLLNFGE